MTESKTTPIQKIVSTTELADAFYYGNEKINGLRVVSAQFVGDWCDGSWLVTLIEVKK